jgi:hypothetical protein
LLIEATDFNCCQFFGNKNIDSQTYFKVFQKRWKNIIKKFDFIKFNKEKLLQINSSIESKSKLNEQEKT